MTNTALKASKKIVRKIICNPFRYLDLYELQKILRDYGGEIDNETKSLIQHAIEEKLDEEQNTHENSYAVEKDFWAVSN